MKCMGVPRFLPSLSWLLLALQFFSLALAADRSLYIVHMDKSAMPRAFATHRNWYSSAIDSLKVSSSDPDPPKLVYSYDNVLHGFSAVLSEDELKALKKSTGFISAYKDYPLVPHTTYTSDFLKLNPATGLLPASKSGEDVIVGVIDTGVWPESKSFSDHGMPEIPKRWKGTCREGTQFSSSLCNRKLIGANYFNAGLRALNPGLSISMNSARDISGHGTHTASTAAGNYVEGVSYFGYAPGTAKGVAPSARIAVYKVLWREGGSSADLLAGMNQAVEDGIDVMSISLGFNVTIPLYQDPIAIAAFGAMTRGVLVSASAGNEGPRYGIVKNSAPWMLTVAAGSTDRWFAGSLTLGNGLKIRGWSTYPGSALVRNEFLFYDETISACNSPELVARVPNPGSTILICQKSDKVNFIHQMNYVRATSIRATIFINDDPNIFSIPGFPYPGAVISPEEGNQVINYAKNGNNPRATITFKETYFGNKPAPTVAAFSSRGPAQSNPGISKPDIMAPGVLVLAAYPPFAYASNGYYLLSGTSMSCPHASGIAAMLKSAHPDWSPAAIRSAMMTTAIAVDNTRNPIKKSYENFTATPLDMGAGLVDPNSALDPGLIYDTTPQDYVNYICTMGFTEAQFYSITRALPRLSCSNPNPDLNYPSFIALYSPESQQFNWLEKTFQRTVTNVGPGAAKYTVKLEMPKNSTISVSPTTLTFGKKNEKQRYTLKIHYRGDKNQSINMGSITWVEVNGNHKVRSPIVVAPSVLVSS